jgi:hypothetical protein|uniref:RING-type domain-containing protein n=1 Tax=viral metagenome TaxID=1070528 RepID=A0A6C0IV35_9ZZZZ
MTTNLCAEQTKRLDKIMYEKLFLIAVEYDGNSTCEVKVTGSTGNLYTVTIDVSKTTTQAFDVFSCNCPDSLKRAKDAKVLCKHSCFVLLRVMRLPVEFFQNVDCAIVKRHIVEFRERIPPPEIVNQQYQLRYLEMSSPEKENRKRKFDVDEKTKIGDDCGICLEPTSDDAACLGCPQCRNCLHKECVDIWLRAQHYGKKACPLCRYSWDDYGKPLSERGFVNLS